MNKRCVENPAIIKMLGIPIMSFTFCLRELLCITEECSFTLGGAFKEKRMLHIAGGAITHLTEWVYYDNCNDISLECNNTDVV